MTWHWHKINTATQQNNSADGREKKLSCITHSAARGRLCSQMHRLPGCLSEGKTKAEAMRNIQDAIKLYMEDVEAEARVKKAKLIQVQL